MLTRTQQQIALSALLLTADQLNIEIVDGIKCPRCFGVVAG